MISKAGENGKKRLLLPGIGIIAPLVAGFGA